MIQKQNILQIAAQYKSKYSNLYFERFSKTLNILEQKRKDILKQTLVICALYFLAAVICLVLCFAMHSVNPSISLFSFIFFAGLVVFGFLTAAEKNEKFVKLLKEDLGSKILTVFAELHYSNEKLSEQDIIKSSIFPAFAVLNTEDCICGKYKNTDLKVCEASLFLDYDTALWNRIYKGIIISFKSNKTIKNTTTVVSKSEINWKLPLIISIIAAALILCIKYALLLMSFDVSEGLLLIIGFLAVFAGIFYEILKKFYFFKRKTPSCEKLLQLKLEDPVFNKKFKACSGDQTEGRYLLTTAFMERFLHLQTVFGTKDIKCSFFDDKLIISISTNQNLFELGNLFERLDSSKYINKFFEEIVSIFIMIDYFKLDETTKL